MREKKMLKKIGLLLGGLVALGVGLLLFSYPYLRLLGGVLIFAGGILASEGLIRFCFDRLPAGRKALKRLQKALKAASKEVLITSGSLNSKAYVEFDEIKEIIKKKVEKGVRFRIICGPKLDPITYREYSELLNKPNFEIYQLNRNPVPHGLLVDGKKLRLEEPHPSGVIPCNEYFRFPLLSKVRFRQLVKEYEQEAVKLTSSETDIEPDNRD